MDLNFDTVAQRFEDLKAKFQSGEISRQEFIDEMKKLRLKDENGRFWMIGAQSGKWYFFDGKDWVQGDPPTQKDQKTICIFCGFENKIEAETCGRCGGSFGAEKNTCPTCGDELQKPFLTCPKCASVPDTLDEVKFAAAGARSKTSEIVLRSVQPLSALSFGGLCGALLGLVFGVLAGATAYFSGSLSFLPDALTVLQGKLLGAVILGLLGGIVGFALGAAAGFSLAVVANFVLSLTGGIRLAASRKAEPPPEKSS